MLGGGFARAPSWTRHTLESEKVPNPPEITSNNRGRTQQVLVENYLDLIFSFSSLLLIFPFLAQLVKFNFGEGPFISLVVGIEME